MAMSKRKNVWGQLFDLCKLLHELLYDRREVEKAKAYLPVLENLLAQISDDSGSIVGAEAFSLYHELKGEREQAIEYRRRELELMNELFEDVRKNDYDENTTRALLNDRDEKELEVRKAILIRLEQRIGQ